MKLGMFLIYASLIATVFSAWHYYRLTVLEKNPKEINLQKKSQKLARIGFYAMTVFVIFASVYLWYLIFNHAFQVDYIYRYTSRDLGTGYLFSAFWAGQEGSFLFWTLMIAVMGVAYMQTARHLESYSMLVITIVQAAFMILLIKASPFALQSGIPADGAGLNPLLQNPWMVIHPPVLFLGYAATTIPFAIALAVLLKRDYSNWEKLALPWALFSSITIGAGIILGAYWAYKVLGWGGYWGWDPVENSSLIAWLVVLALFHGLIVTKLRNTLHRTGFMLAILSFSTVLYATFLTRSGVLADFSVHSFQDLGINGYLTIYILAATFSGIGLLIARRKSIPFNKISGSVFTKEQVLVVTIIVISLSAFFTLIGTSSPLLSKLVGNPAQVDASFYNKINLPLAIVMAFLLGVAPLLTWRQEPIKDILIRLIPSFVLAVISLIIAFVVDMSGILNLLFITSAVFALTSNFVVFAQKIKLGWRMVVAPLSHVGVAFMFIGILISGLFSESERSVLTKNVSKNVLGYDLVYKSDFTSPEDGKHGLKIDIKDGDDIFQGDPRLYLNSYTQSSMSEPFLEEGLFNDVYLSLMQKIDDNAATGSEFVLTKGEHKDYAGYHILFKTFNMSQNPENKEFVVAAILEFTKEGKTFEVRPSLSMNKNKQHPHPAIIPDSQHGSVNPTVTLASINAEQGQIKLAFNGLDEGPSTQKPEKVVVEVSNKPFMGILWIGTIILTLGSILAMHRRTEEIKLIPLESKKIEHGDTCSKCKTVNKETAKFCENCGNKLKVVKAKKKK
jgi:cytochrome c-type biogenesis protein CcmF